MSNWSNEGRNFMRQTAEDEKTDTIAKLERDLAAERALVREVMAERNAARAESARLRDLVERSFAEGVLIAARSTAQVEHGLACWPMSKAKAALEEKR